MACDMFLPVVPGQRGCHRGLGMARTSLRAMALTPPCDYTVVGAYYYYLLDRDRWLILTGYASDAGFYGAVARGFLGLMLGHLMGTHVSLEPAAGVWLNAVACLRRFFFR